MPQNSNSPQHPNEHTLHSNQDDLGPTIVCAPFAGYLTLLVGQVPGERCTHYSGPQIILV